MEIYFQIDNTWSPHIGTLDIPGGSDVKSWTTLSCKINDVKGIHVLHFTFAVEEEKTCNIDWFKFNKRIK
ncbi:MAG: carbohydrate-binding protein [Flavobacterium sp.]|nr:carbohydrate-binding protein [Pedobacter sp.]